MDISFSSRYDGSSDHLGDIIDANLSRELNCEPLDVETWAEVWRNRGIGSLVENCKHFGRQDQWFYRTQWQTGTAIAQLLHMTAAAVGFRKIGLGGLAIAKPGGRPMWRIC